MNGMLKRSRDVLAVEGTEGRNPFEVLLLLWPLLAGASYAFGSSRTSQEFLPHWMVIAWFILLCTGGLVGLVGVWLRNPILSLLWERVAMFMFGIEGIVFSTVLYFQRVDPQFEAQARASGISVLLFALAALWRLLRIHFYLRRLRAQLSEGGG